MLHGAAKLLTLLSVLLHAGIGCCAHHDHCDALHSEAPAAEKQELPQTYQCTCSFHAHCDAAAATDPEESEHSSCPCDKSHGSCTDHCSWLTTSRVELPADPGMVLLLAVVDGFGLNASGVCLVACARLGNPPLVSELTLFSASHFGVNRE